MTGSDCGMLETEKASLRRCLPHRQQHHFFPRPVFQRVYKPLYPDISGQPHCRSMELKTDEPVSGPECLSKRPTYQRVDIHPSQPYFSLESETQTQTV